MNFEELRRLLSIEAATLRGWIRKGLPASGRGAKRRFEAEAVAAWLLANGHAQQRATAATIAEVAQHFQVADRTVSYWISRGMPGDRGAFDLDAIAAWRQREGLARSDEDSARSEGQKIKNQRETLRLERERGALVAVEPLRRLFVRHIHEAKAIFEAVPDRLLGILPSRLPANAKAWQEIRRQFRGAAQGLVSEVCRALGDVLSAAELPPEEM